MTQIHTTLDACRVPIESLTPYDGNPRRGQTAVIADSLAENGQYRPIVVNSRDNRVLAGNHTLAAAISLGWEEIAASFVDVDDDRAAKIVLVDNRSNDLAGYDDQALVDLLQDLPDIDGTGYDAEALDKLLRSLSEDDNFDTGPALGAIEYRIVIDCDDESHQAALLERFEGDGLRARALAQ